MPEETLTSLEESTEKAVTELEAASTETEESVTETEAEDSEEEEEVEVEASASLTAEQQRAIDLYDALNDPTKSTDTILQLAKQKGLLPSEGTKSTVKSLEDIARENLGDAYGMIAPAIAAILEEVLNTRVNPQFQQVNQVIAQSHLETALISFAERHELDIESSGTASLFTQMTKLAEEMPRTGKVSVNKYLDNIYRVIKSEEATSTKKLRKINKIKRNSEDADPESASSGLDPSRVIKGPDKPTLQQAIDAAVQGIELQ